MRFKPVSPVPDDAAAACSKKGLTRTATVIAAVPGGSASFVMVGIQGSGMRWVWK